VTTKSLKNVTPSTFKSVRNCKFYIVGIWRMYALCDGTTHVPVVRLYNWIFANCMIAAAHGTIVGARTRIKRFTLFVVFVTFVASPSARPSLNCITYDLRKRYNRYEFSTISSYRFNFFVGAHKNHHLIHCFFFSVHLLNLAFKKVGEKQRQISF